MAVPMHCFQQRIELASPRWAAKGVGVTWVHQAPRVKLIALEANPQRYDCLIFGISDPSDTVFHVLSLRSLAHPSIQSYRRVQQGQYEKSRTFDPAIHSTEVSKWDAWIKQRMLVVWRHLKQNPNAQGYAPTPIATGKSGGSAAILAKDS